MTQNTPTNCTAPSTAHAVAPAINPNEPDNRTTVTAPCTCDRRYKGDRWAPPSVSVLSLPGVADQDIADAVGIAQCRMRSLQVMVERDGLDPLQAQAQANPAKVYADNAEKHLLTPRGLSVAVAHVL